MYFQQHQEEQKATTHLYSSLSHITPSEDLTLELLYKVKGIDSEKLYDSVMSTPSCYVELLEKDPTLLGKYSKKLNYLLPIGDTFKTTTKAESTNIKDVSFRKKQTTLRTCGIYFEANEDMLVPFLPILNRVENNLQDYMYVDYDRFTLRHIKKGTKFGLNLVESLYLMTTPEINNFAMGGIINLRLGVSKIDNRKSNFLPVVTIETSTYLGDTLVDMNKIYYGKRKKMKKKTLDEIELLSKQEKQEYFKKLEKEEIYEIQEYGSTFDNEEDLLRYRIHMLSQIVPSKNGIKEVAHWDSEIGGVIYPEFEDSFGGIYIVKDRILERYLQVQNEIRENPMQFEFTRNGIGKNIQYINQILSGKR